MKRGNGWLLAAALAALLALPAALGTPLRYARELEERAMVRTMGVDAEGENFTLSMATDAESGSEPADGSALLTGTGDLLGRTALEIQTQTDRSIFYGCVGQYLIGENAAAAQFSGVLDYFAMEQELRLGTKLYVVRAGTAGAAMEALTAAGASVPDRLENMGKNEGLGSFGAAYSLREVLAQLGRSGAALSAAVQRGEENGRPTLEAAGYAILDEDGLLGYLTGDAACGANLLLGKTARDCVTVTTARGATAGLLVTGASTGVKPEFDAAGALVRLRLLVKIEASVQETRGVPDPASEETVGELEELLAETERARCENVVALSQLYKADFLELGVRVSLVSPLRGGALRENWRAIFPDIRIDVEVEAHVRRVPDQYLWLHKRFKGLAPGYPDVYGDRPLDRDAAIAAANAATATAVASAAANGAVDEAAD